MGMRRVWGLELAIAGLKVADGDYVIIVGSDSPEHLLEEYRVRWGTETLFGCLKSRGFELEDTHLTDPARLSKLLAVLALAFALRYRRGRIAPASGCVTLSPSA